MRTRCFAGRAGIVVGASVAALLIWFVNEPLFVSPAAVVLTSLLAGLAGWGLLALLELLTRRPRRIWLAVAVPVLLVSLLGPLTADAPPSAIAALLAMHSSVGAILIAGLSRSTACSTVDPGLSGNA